MFKKSFDLFLDFETEIVPSICHCESSWFTIQGRNQGRLNISSVWWGVCMVRSLGALQGSSMGCHQVFSQIPFVLDHLVTNIAVDSLWLNVHIDYVLLQIEAVGECLPAVVAKSWLHTSPPLSGMGDSTAGNLTLLLTPIMTTTTTASNINIGISFSRLLTGVWLKVQGSCHKNMLYKIFVFCEKVFVSRKLQYLHLTIVKLRRK